MSTNKRFLESGSLFAWHTNSRRLYDPAFEVGMSKERQGRAKENYLFGAIGLLREFGQMSEGESARESTSI